jgi:hypothetical protein
MRKSICSSYKIQNLISIFSRAELGLGLRARDPRLIVYDGDSSCEVWGIKLIDSQFTRNNNA